MHVELLHMEATAASERENADLQQPAEDLLHCAAAFAMGAPAPVQRLSSSAQHQIRMPLQQPRVPGTYAERERTKTYILRWQSDGSQSAGQLPNDLALLTQVMRRVCHAPATHQDRKKRPYSLSQLPPSLTKKPVSHALEL